METIGSPTKWPTATTISFTKGLNWGSLGLLASVGLFVAMFFVGVRGLLWEGQNYSTIHKLVLIALLATLAGRTLELMVGVARVSDLTISWVLLAVFVALPPLIGKLRGKCRSRSGYNKHGMSRGGLAPSLHQLRAAFTGNSWGDFC